MKIHNFISSLIFLFFTTCLPVSLMAQSGNTLPATGNIHSTDKNQNQNTTRKVKKSEAKIEANREKEEKAYDRAKADDMKHRMDLQTPETRKRMMESRKQAERNNNHYHKTLWQKIFGQ